MNAVVRSFPPPATAAGGGGGAIVSGMQPARKVARPGYLPGMFLAVPGGAALSVLRRSRAPRRTAERRGETFRATKRQPRALAERLLDLPA